MTERRRKVAVLGSARVGKTALLRRYLNGSYTERYKTTTEDIYSRDFTIHGCAYKLDIHDVGGDVDPGVAISDAVAFILVFSLDDNDSLDYVIKLLDVIPDERPDDIKQLPIIIAGNKSDLDQKLDVHQLIETHLSKKELLRTSAYHECSAKEDTNVITVFASLAKIAVPIVNESVDTITRETRRLSLVFTGERRSSLRAEDAAEAKEEDEPAFGLVRRASRRLSNRLKKMAAADQIQNGDCIVS